MTITILADTGQAAEAWTKVVLSILIVAYLVWWAAFKRDRKP